MTDVKFSALTSGSPVAADLFPFVKVADTSTPPAGAGGSDQKVTFAALAQRMAGKALVPANNYCAGDGVTDDTTGMQAAINAVFSGAGLGLGGVYCPDQYLISSSLTCTSATGSGGFGVSLVGADKDASQIIKNFTGALVTFNGSGGPTGNPNQFGGLRNITLNGNAHTGALLQTNSAQQMFFENTSFIGNPDKTLDLTAMQDSYFVGCTSNNCGSTTEPVINITDSSSGTANMLWFIQCRLESFLNGAVWIKSATSGANNGFFFSQCKFETTTIHGDLFVADGSVQQLIIDQCFFALDAFAGGYSTPANCVAFGTAAGAAGGNQFLLSNTWVHNATGTLNSILNVNGAAGAMTGPVVIRNVFADGTPVTSALIYNGVADAYIRWADVITGGTLVTGDGSWYVNGADNSFDFLGGIAFQGTLTPSSAQPALGGFGKGLGISGVTAGTGAYIFGAFSSTDTGTTPANTSFLVSDKGVASSKGGWDSSGSAVASTPSLTSTVAAQLSTTQDVMLYINTHTATATLAVAIGPTSTPANTIVASATAPITSLYSIRVPKGWYVKATFTSADVTFTQVTC